MIKLSESQLNAVTQLAIAVIQSGSDTYKNNPARAVIDAHKALSEIGGIPELDFRTGPGEHTE